MKYCFEPTEGKLEYLQLEFNNAEEAHEHQPIDYDGALYLENGMWVNYYRCEDCDKRFTCFGKFTPGEEE